MPLSQIFGLTYLLSATWWQLCQLLLYALNTPVPDPAAPDP